MNWFKQHADTFVIVGVNLALAAIFMTMWISNSSSISALNSRMDQANCRMDTLHVMFYDLLKEGKK